MDRFRRMSRGGWIVVGLLLGSLLLPIGIASAASLVTIAGSGGVTAEVTSEHQLLTAEAGPKTFYINPDVLSTTCRSIATPPSGFALVVKEIHVNTRSSSFDASHGLRIYRGSNCTGLVVLVDTPAGLGSKEHRFDPGLVIPGGTALSATGFGTGFQADLAVIGYKVPAGSV